MRFGRNIVILSVLVCALAGILLALRLWRPEAPLQGGDPLFPMPVETIVGVTWDTKDAEGHRVPMELRREGELWRMTRPYAGAVCDVAAVADLLDAAQALRVTARLGGQTVTDFRPDRQLTLRTADGARTCGFGEVLPMRLSETLAEIRGSLVSVEATAVARLPVHAATLRSRAVLPVAPERLLSLEWRAPGRPFTRAQRMTNGNWSVTQPFPFEVKACEALEALSALTEARAIAAYVLPADNDAFTPEGYARPCPTSESALAGYGLDEESAIRVAVHIRGLGETTTLRFGAEDPERPGHVFCLLNGMQAVVSVPAALRELFGAQGPFVTDYRDLPVLGDAELFDRLIFRAGSADAPTELTRTRAGWAMTLPINLPADSVTVRSLLRGLASLTGDLTGTEQPKNEALCLLTLDRASGGSPVELLLYPEKSNGDLLLAYRADLHRLYRVRREAIPEILLRGGFAHALADRTVLAEPAAGIRRITVLRRDGSQISVVRPGASLVWETEKPKGAYINPTLLDAWLTQFADLKAVRVLRGVPTAFGALRSYGLDRPLLRLTLDLEGEAGLRRVLLVGDPDPQTGVAPAWVQGRPILYELDAETVALLSRPIVNQENMDK